MLGLRRGVLALFVVLAASWTSTTGRADAAPAPAATAAPFTLLYHFVGGNSANWPRGGVALDTNGTIYGTTLYNGPCPPPVGYRPYCGVVYSLAKPAAGKTVWTYKVIHAFGGPTYSEGRSPIGPLTFVKNTIYGTTSAGADPSCGCGEIFKMVKAGSGWKYTILHRFNRTQGSTPTTGVTVASDGTIYGVASAGGAPYLGVIYKLSTKGAFTVLHTFTQATGATPQGELIFGKDGALYGTGFGGGKYNQGVVYRITTGGAYSVIYTFLGVNQPGNSHDGAQPEGRLALGPDGTIYGTTAFGGTPSGYGTAWSLTPPAAGKTTWGYKEIYIFGKDPTQPNLTHSGLVRDAAGFLYGSSAGGGTYGGGTLYRLNPPKGTAPWTVTVLHVFVPRNINGDTPYADLLLSGGLLYGTTLTGGIINGSCNNGCGTVFTYLTTP